MASNKTAQASAARVYKSEGAQRAPKWERTRVQTSWCNVCHDYTEQDRLGCVDCYDPERDKIEEMEDPDASQFANPKKEGPNGK